jgi:hypothetical protein
MKKFLILLFVLMLVGCASPGSPAHTSSLTDQELRGIDNYTLCVAASPRELYSPSYSVMREVGRRGINCRNIYIYTPTPQPQQIIIQQQGPVMMQNPAACIQDGGSTYCPRYRR